MLWSYPGPLQTQFLHAGIQFYWQWSTQQSLYGCLNARVPDHEMRCQQAHFRSSPNVCEQLREVMDMESVWTHLACAMHGIYQGLRKEAWEIDASCQNSVVCFLSCKCTFMLYMSLTALSLQTKSLNGSMIMCSCYAAAPLPTNDAECHEINVPVWPMTKDYHIASYGKERLEEMNP